MLAAASLTRAAHVALAAAARTASIPAVAVRSFSSVPAAGSAKEAEISALLTDKLQAQKVTIKDVSGGCGAFYEISVVSPLFAGKSTIQQHRQVNSVLGPIIGTLHGLTLKTSVPA